MEYYYNWCQCHREIKRRIAIGKEAFSKRGELHRRKLDKHLKIRMIKTLICSVVPYGSETWTKKRRYKNTGGL